MLFRSEGKGVAELKDHGWFASFAGGTPDSPEIAVVVLVENGGFGGYVAAPIAKAVYEAYFTPQAPAAAPEAAAEPAEGD